MELQLIAKKIEALENDLIGLKALVQASLGRKNIALKGTLKGLKTTSLDFKKAENVLFPASQ